MDLVTEVMKTVMGGLYLYTHLVPLFINQIITVWAQDRINWKRTIPRHTVIKKAKIKEKEKLLKAARGKQQVTYKGTAIRLSDDFSAETLQPKREWQDIFEMMKDKNQQQEYPTCQGFHSNFMERSEV